MGAHVDCHIYMYVCESPHQRVLHSQKQRSEKEDIDDQQGIYIGHRRMACFESPNVDFIMRTQASLGKNIEFFASLLFAMNCIGMLNAM